MARNFASLLITVFIFCLHWAGSSKAQTLELAGNSFGAQQSVVMESGGLTQLFQINQSQIKNTISAFSSTGHNSLSLSSPNGTISTGDASVKVEIKNLINQNLSTNSCCSDPVAPSLTPTPTPPLAATSTPKPTQAPSISFSGSPDNKSISITNQPTGAAPVLGLSNTSAAAPAQLTENIIISLGAVCLTCSVFVLKSAFRG